MARLAPYDLVVVDGELTGAGRVAQLRAGGTIVLGYLSVGTIEPFRSWYRKLKPFRAARPLRGVRRVLRAGVGERASGARSPNRIAPKLLGKGFDGLFLDNTDMVEGHPEAAARDAQPGRAASRTLVHGRGGLLFAQNGEQHDRPAAAASSTAGTARTSPGPTASSAGATCTGRRRTSRRPRRR